MRKFSNQELEELASTLNKPSLFAEVDDLRTNVSEAFRSQGGRWFSADLLERVILWKLDRQYSRSRAMRELNHDSVVVPVTKATLEVKSDSLEYEVEVKLRLLASLRGVATPISSAVLAFSEPERFAVIDSLLWEFLYGQEKSAFTPRDYLKYLSDLEPIAKQFAVPIHTLEHAVWIVCSNQSIISK